MVKRVGQYELGKTLGHGTFSKVKLAIDLRDRTSWAVKIVDRKQVVEEHMEAQLRQEIAIMKILHHNGIVNLKEVLQTQRNIYIVLELVTGGELFDRIVQEKRFDEKRARKFFHQLIKGLEYCHKNEIAHRDLKPENMLLTDKEVLKISDFGLSNLSDRRNTMLTTTCGTPNYVAPEVLAEKGYDGFKADIWSSGVILFVMLGGYLPFDDPTLNGLFEKIENGEYSTPKWFPADASDLISKMLVVDPKKRITIANIKKHKWFQVGFVDDKVVSANVEAADAEHAFQPAEEMIMSSSGIEDPGISSFNAFDLASHLMAGSLNPLMAGKELPARRFTTFMANGSRAEILDKLLSVLRGMNAQPTLKEGTLQLKCAKVVTRVVMFIVTVIPTITERLCMVEFRRSRGGALEFNSVYREAYALLSSIITEEEGKGKGKEE